MTPGHMSGLPKYLRGDGYGGKDRNLDSTDIQLQMLLQMDQKWISPKEEITGL